MKIYVSCSSNELPAARLLIDQLRNRGHEIAHDWPSVIDASGGRANPTDVTREQKRAWVGAEIQAIVSSDAFVMLAPADPTLTGGMFVELGFASARLIPCYVLGQWDSIFSVLATPVESSEHLFQLIGHGDRS